MSKDQVINVRDREIAVSHPKKALFRNPAITKMDVAEYYKRISAVLIPLAKNRPDTMRRFPRGVNEKGFFQKRASKHFPAWIQRKRIISKSADPVEYVLLQEAATLVYLAQLDTVEHHTWLSKADKPDTPDQIVFDLDPVGDDFASVVFAAKELKKLCKEIGLIPFAKATGSKGLHVVIPVKRSWGFDRVRGFARDIAEVLAKRHPDKLTTQHRKDKRKGRLYLDMNRNAFGQTAVASYSLRAKNGAPVAAPVRWDELDQDDFHSQKYHLKNIFQRLGQIDDPWKDFEKSARSLVQPEKKVKKLLQ